MRALLEGGAYGVRTVLGASFEPLYVVFPNARVLISSSLRSSLLLVGAYAVLRRFASSLVFRSSHPALLTLSSWKDSRLALLLAGTVAALVTQSPMPGELGTVFGSEEGSAAPPYPMAL